MKITIKDVCKSYGDISIFNNLNMTIRDGEVTCLLGPSGCGKTTLLNLVSGLKKPDSGFVVHEPEERISYIFQTPRLLPWKTAFENVRYIIPNSYTNAEKIEITRHYLKETGLAEFHHLLPHELSGGMQRRVSIARAFAYPSSLLIMDEPFVSLDEKTKGRMIALFQILMKKDGRTVLFVTHDRSEASLLGDRVYEWTDNLGERGGFSESSKETELLERVTVEFSG